MSKQKIKPPLTQSEIGKYWTLHAVAQKHSVPPTNIVRASKGVPGKPKIRSHKMCGRTGIEVYYEPDVKALLPAGRSGHEVVCFSTQAVQGTDGMTMIARVADGAEL